MSIYDANLLTESREKSEYFEAVLVEGLQPRTVAHWVNGEVSALDAPPKAEHLRRLLQLIADGTISGKMAKDVLHEIARGDYLNVDDLIEAKGLRQISDVGALEKAVDQVLAANAKQVDDYRAGK